MTSEAKDSLKSKATLTLLDLLGEGRIGGLVNGNKSVFFNDTQLQNDDGTYNFQGVTSTFVDGQNTQSLTGNYGNYVETPYNIGAQVKVATPHTFAVVNPVADAVRVIVSVPGLSVTDTESGDIRGSSVQYKFQMSINGGAFTDVPATRIWTVDGTWSTSGTTKTATAMTGSFGVRATLKASVNTAYRKFGALKVQPQTYNGSAWINLGGQREITVTAASAGFINGVEQFTQVSDVVTVESPYTQVRFLKISATAWVEPAQGDILSNTSTPVITIEGKTRSKYQRKHVLSIPRPANSVEVRMVRITPDSTSAYLANDTYLDSYYEIISLNMVYPNSALYGVTIDSEQFNQIPSRAYLVDGLYIKVPTNYDPVTRAYTGVWDGTFKLAVSDNPAWIMYDILTNTRYGLGNYLTSTQVDKATLYTIGRYCDEMVDDGFGGQEPRFTLNTVINSREEAYKVVSDIASVFRGMSYWSGGMACFTQDAPTDPSMLYGRANVIDGAFSYTGSARKDRHSVVHVTWNDPDENYKKKIEYVEDAELMQMYGVRKLDTLAFGCASRGQANRVGRWILYTEKFESDFITFKVGLDSAFVTPGDVVKIQDPARAGRRVAGRLIACTSTSATLDAPTEMSAGASISIMLPNGSFVDRTLLQTSGTHTTVTWASALPELPEANAMWLVQEENLVPILARVVSVAQASNTEFEITAIEHNPSKYVAIEEGLALTKRPVSIIDPSFVHAPSQVSVSETQYLSAPGVLANKLLVSWFGDCTSYELIYQGISESNKSSPIKVIVQDALSHEILNVSSGVYQVSLTGINPLGKRSTTVTVTHTVQGRTAPPSNVTSMSAALNSNGVTLSWTSVSDFDLKTYEVRKSAIAYGDWGTAEYVGQSQTPFLDVTEESFGDYQWQVKAINTWGIYSTQPAYASIKLQQVFALENVLVTTGFRQFFVRYDIPTTRPDFGGARVHVSLVPGFTPSPQNVVYDGSSNFVTVAALANGTLLEADTTYYVRVVGYSRINQSELNYSMEYSVTPASPIANATAVLYQWSTMEPTPPSGSADYVWSSGLVINYGGANGWSADIPTNPGTAGLQLWQASTPVGSTEYAPSVTAIDWDNGSTIRAISVNGNTGAKGDDGAAAQVLRLTSSGYTFTFDADGTANPASQTVSFVAELQNLTGTATFTATRYTSGGQVIDNVALGGSGNTRTLTSAQFGAAAYTVVTASLGGLSDSVRAVRLANGYTGSNGARTAVLDVYKWSATEPTSSFPEGTSTYTWATAQFTAPANLNGWSLTPPAPVIGQTLWIARTVYTDTNTSATSSVTWAASSARAVAASGTNGGKGDPGTNGTRTAVLEVYKWSAATPTTFPSGTSTYTWADGTFTAPATPNGWSVTPGTPVLGQTLWGCSVSYADQLTSATSTVTWNTSAAYSAGYAGDNGAAGANAISGLLTNESSTVAAASDGTVASYASAGGTFKVWDGTTEKTGTSVTYSVVSGSASGVTISIANTGVYTISDMSADTGSATLRAVYGGVTIDKIYTIAKSKAGNTGAAGATGVQAAKATVYQWANSIPSGPTGTATYTWASGAFGSAPSGWTLTAGTGSAGQTLYAATVNVTDSAANTSTSFNWTSASITVAGYNGTNGSNGSPGTNGYRTAVLTAFQWASSTPTSFPSGDVTYTWADGSWSMPATPNGWSRSPGAGSAGQTLYAIDQIISNNATSATTVVAWTGNTPYAAGAAGTNGTAGAAGYSYAVAKLFGVATNGTASTSLALPTGTSTFTWATQKTTPGSSKANGWSTDPPTPSAGYTLWELCVPLSSNTNPATTTINWDTITSTEYYFRALTTSVKGDTGNQGASSRTAYARIANNPTPTSGSITVTGDARPTQTQSNTTWGLNVAWSASDPSPTSTNTLYQTDGIYNPATGQTVWTTPYISSLKVGSLSAITTNTGTLTVSGTVSTANGNFSVDAAGAVTIKSATSGARTELTNSYLKVFDSSGTLRVQIGDLAA